MADDGSVATMPSIFGQTAPSKGAPTGAAAAASSSSSAPSAEAPPAAPAAGDAGSQANTPPAPPAAPPPAPPAPATPPVTQRLTRSGAPPPPPAVAGLPPNLFPPVPAAQAPPPSPNAPTAQPGPAPAAAAPAAAAAETGTPPAPTEGGFVLPAELDGLMEPPPPPQPSPPAPPAPAPAPAAPPPEHRYANGETQAIARFYQNGGTLDEYSAYTFAKSTEAMEPLDVAVAEILHNYPQSSRAEAIAGLERQLNAVLVERTETAADGTTRTIKPDAVSSHQLHLYAEQARSRIAKNMTAFTEKSAVENQRPAAATAAGTPGPSSSKEGAAGPGSPVAMPDATSPSSPAPGDAPAVASGPPSEVAMRVAQQIVSANRSLGFDYHVGGGGDDGENLSLVGAIPDDQVVAFERSVAGFIDQETRRLGGKVTPANLPEFQANVQDFTRRFYTVLNPNFIRDIATSAYQAGAKSTVRRDKGVAGQLFRSGGAAQGANRRGGGPAAGVGAGSRDPATVNGAQTQNAFWAERGW